jgi:hypothetical protein
MSASSSAMPFKRAPSVGRSLELSCLVSFEQRHDEVGACFSPCARLIVEPVSSSGPRNDGQSPTPGVQQTFGMEKLEFQLRARSCATYMDREVPPGSFARTEDRRRYRGAD